MKGTLDRSLHTRPYMLCSLLLFWFHLFLLSFWFFCSSHTDLFVSVMPWKRNSFCLRTFALAVFLLRRLFPRYPRGLFSHFIQVFTQKLPIQRCLIWSPFTKCSCNISYPLPPPLHLSLANIKFYVFISLSSPLL